VLLIDGSADEGGGKVLRTALGLSLSSRRISHHANDGRPRQLAYVCMSVSMLVDAQMAGLDQGQ
jgi:RNA 3'-terminal phosphate cyclase